MSGPFARDVLLKLKWKDGNLGKVTLVIRSRGGPVPTAEVPAGPMTKIGRSFITFDDGTMVPFHRVELIRIGDLTLWSRPRGQIDVEDHHVLGR